MPIDRRMDKEVVLHKRILSAIKRNAFESVLKRWMNLVLYRVK